jgi:hypothetical protein
MAIPAVNNIQVYREHRVQLSQDGSGVAFTGLPTDLPIYGPGSSFGASQWPAPGQPITHWLLSKDIQSYQAGGEQVLSIAANTANQAGVVQVPSTITWLRIETTQPITLKLNGSGNFAIPITPTTSANGIFECSFNGPLSGATANAITSYFLSTPVSNAAAALVFISQAGY